jgi:twitching motility protein PilT
MELDFADVLMEVINRRASDLHLTVGAPPMVRVRGRLTPIEGYERLDATQTREIVYSILSNSQRQRLENDWQLDFAYTIPSTARFRVNAYFQRASVGAAFRLIPFDVVPLESLGLPPVVADFANRPRGLVLADRRDQPDARGAHHDHRGSDRVPAPAQEVRGQSARARLGRHVLLRCAEGGTPPGS